MGPSLVAPEELPARWRFALRALGVPVLEELTSVALGQGVSVLTLAPSASFAIDIERQDRIYVGRVLRVRQLLAA